MLLGKDFKGNKTKKLVSLLGTRPVLDYSLFIQKKCRAWRKKGLSLAECAKRLNAEGIKTFRGFDWKRARLHQVLKHGSI